MATAQMIGWPPATFWASNYFEFTSALVGQHKMSGVSEAGTGKKNLPLKNPDDILASLRARAAHRVVNAVSKTTLPLSGT